MCDYSLEHLTSRPAAVGDRLVTTRFGDSISRGFASPDQRDVAVCLRPGTELAFDRDVEVESILAAGREKIPARVARFRQIDVATAHVHHDALEFPDGRVVLLTRLAEGQHANVLQLPAQPQPTQPETVGTRAEKIENVR
jgi:hypothetical protein